MSFHRGGQYAVNMGLDPDNVLRIGGWSAPANLWQLDMGGNQTLSGSIRPGSAATGTGCSQEGAFAYDFSTHSPIFCSQGGVWIPIGKTCTLTRRTVGHPTLCAANEVSTQGYDPSNTSDAANCLLLTCN